jgi:hypothetical protein
MDRRRCKLAVVLVFKGISLVSFSEEAQEEEEATTSNSTAAAGIAKPQSLKVYESENNKMVKNKVEVGFIKHFCAFFCIN